jgi:S-adenosylmethionine synthetase
MFEKVNPSHPDKLADRIAGALVDYAYTKEENPRIAVEVLLGHGLCDILAESSVPIPDELAATVVNRIVGKPIETCIRCVPQDPHLSGNQEKGIRCGDNGIFKGVPVSDEEQELADLAGKLYRQFPTDGKHILRRPGYGSPSLIICQSNAGCEAILDALPDSVKDTIPTVKVNPLGPWTGGPDVDAGATNRKLGSDMGRGVTGGGLHGKDLSKADVSVNIYAHLLAQETGHPVEFVCAIGDDNIAGIPYPLIVRIARDFIREVGGFEKFAEWGLIRPQR